MLFIILKKPRTKEQNLEGELYLGPYDFITLKTDNKLRLHKGGGIETLQTDWDSTLYKGVEFHTFQIVKREKVNYSPEEGRETTYTPDIPDYNAIATMDIKELPLFMNMDIPSLFKHLLQYRLKEEGF